ncbi:immunity 52 family protein [Archangium violaceum]|uniref:immunity 52 family protein n=1 Tax=Archangium violaceum TaxID=83451 RepID=UPI00194DE0C0|nr:immunity 52 family protein [Archangium violaceum]QRN96275.1 immunity 52 family protein [Archangium violaceum]
MRETYAAGVYWPARAETAEQCARRAETFFRLLSRCDTSYTRWFEKAHSLEKALQLQFEPTYETFLRFFGEKKYRRGKTDKDGFNFGAWNGDEEGSNIMLTCGTSSRYFPNTCILHLPSVDTEAGRILSAPVMTEVVRALVLAWEPEDGGVFSDAYQESRNEPVGPPRTGWLMYLSRRRGEVPPLPAPVRVEPVEDKGSLVILTPERFTVDDPAHVALADEVRALLDRAGLLKESSAYSSTPS